MTNPNAAVPSSVDKTRSCALLETFKDGLPVPKVLVFDLDYTLWPFWVDTHVSPPLKKKDAREGGEEEKGRTVVDCLGESFTFYPSVPDLFLSLKSLPRPPILAIASRSSAPQLATILLKELYLPHPSPPSSSSSSLSSSPPSAGEIVAAVATTKENTCAPFKAAHEFFDCIKIFPGDKKRHFAEIRKVTGVGYEEMVFFDDEIRNRNVETLGVVMLLVENGVSALEVDKGVREWRRRKEKGKPE